MNPNSRFWTLSLRSETAEAKIARGCQALRSFYFYGRRHQPYFKIPVCHRACRGNAIVETSFLQYILR